MQVSSTYKLVQQLQPARLAASGLLTADLFTQLVQSLLTLSGTFQQPTDLVPALAAALPYLFSGPAVATAQLLECYSLFTQFCLTPPTELDDSSYPAEQNSRSDQEQQDVNSVLGPSAMASLQQHLKGEFVQPGASRLSVSA